MGLSSSLSCCTGRTYCSPLFDTIKDSKDLLDALKTEYDRVKFLTGSFNENFYLIKTVTNENVIGENQKLKYKDEYLELSYYLNLSSILLKIINYIEQNQNEKIESDSCLNKSLMNQSYSINQSMRSPPTPPTKKAHSEIRNLPRILNLDKSVHLCREIIKTEEDFNEEGLMRLNCDLESKLFIM
jgi:hypothetical protein